MRIRERIWMLGMVWLAAFPACSLVGLSSAPSRRISSLEAAELALASGDVVEAGRLFDGILGEAPGDARALLGSARASLAAGQGERAVERFAAYRASGEHWGKVVQWENCSALALATDQVLGKSGRPARALELAQQLEDEHCDEPRSDELLLRSGLAVADEARAAGDPDRALALYLELVKRRAPDRAPGDTERDDSPRARAYLAATDILLAAGRREEALDLLSRGLDELPGNRDLVHRMVTVLADGSSVVFPRAKPPAPSTPASPD